MGQGSARHPPGTRGAGPRGSAFYVGDIPPVPEKVDCRLAEYVMTQIESPANVDRWPDPAGQLISVAGRCQSLLEGVRNTDDERALGVRGREQLTGPRTRRRFVIAAVP